MSGDKTNYVTKEGLKKIEEELQHLVHTKRKEIALRIQEAKELGDLSENAEYSDAKEEQALTAARIIELETMLKNTELIAHKKNTDIVEVGSAVTVKGEEGVLTYTIVGSSEADPLSLKISNESPLGSAFIGKNKGDEVVVKTPGGDVTYTIEGVE